jgi:beta-lactamase family protein
MRRQRPNLTAELQGIFRKTPRGVQIGAVVLKPSGDRAATIQGGRKFAAGALAGLGIAYARQAAIRAAVIKEDYWKSGLLPSDNAPGPSLLRPLYPEDTVLVEDATTLMLRWGDVVARRIVVRNLSGPKRVNRLVHGAPTQLYCPQPQDESAIAAFTPGHTTADDAARLCRAIMDNIVSREALQTSPLTLGLRRDLIATQRLAPEDQAFVSRRLLNSSRMDDETYSRVIELGTPHNPHAGIMAVDTTAGIAHDVAHIWTGPNRRYTVAMLTSGWEPCERPRDSFVPTEHPAYELMARVGTLVYEFANAA